MAGVVLTFKVMFGCMMKLIIEVKKKNKRFSSSIFMNNETSLYIILSVLLYIHVVDWVINKIKVRTLHPSVLSKNKWICLRIKCAYE